MNANEFLSQFLHGLVETPEWKSMENTVEGTKWHREANVAVHTMMTIDHYTKVFAIDRTERQRVLTTLALAFHDFGKPPAETTNELGGHRYIGHEPISAKLLVEFFEREGRFRDLVWDYGFGWDEINALALMIENHLPYGMKRPERGQKLKNDLKHHLGDDQVVFFDMLRSDTAGRIMDDRQSRLTEVEEWIASFHAAKKYVPYQQRTPEENARRKAEWMAKQAALKESAT